MTANPDQFYESFGKNMYRLTGNEVEDDIFEAIGSNPGADNSGNVQTASSDIGGGVSTATVQQASGSMQSGKTTFDNTVAGYILGFDPKDGKAKFYLGNSTKYINWDGTTLTVVGGVSISSLDIPDVTTASSFHVDVSGNSWWGANVASGYANANAYILATGAAVFKNVQIGGSTVQYVITNSGIFSYGDGSDGAAVLDGSATPAGMSKSGSDYTLTRDGYYTDMTMSTGTTLNTAGYRVFGNGTLTLNGTAKISRDGNAGTSVVNQAAGGAGGAALADGYLKGSPAGGTGGTSSTTVTVNPTDGTNTTNSIGSSANAAGAGGAGSGGAGSAAGATGTATASNVKLIANWHLATLLDVGSTGSTVKFGNSASAGGGGYGGIGGGAAGGGGGGTGSPGGIVAIYFRSIVIGASASITANGGNGGNGSSGLYNGTVQGGGGGGSGGNGGQVILVYNQLTNSGTVSATGGTKGTGGTAGAGAVAGSDGTAGSAGNIRQFQLSL